MPLSSPAPRRLIHTRDVQCHGYRRDDGLWDVEGYLSDIKTYGFETDERSVPPGDRIHGMRMRLTVDTTFTVHGVEAVTEDSPYIACPQIVDNFQRLIGLTIGPGWTRAIKERLSGVHGCTHLVEMLGPLATVAFQTIYPLMAKEKREYELAEAAAGRPVPPSADRPALLNVCHIMASDGEVTRRHWPDFYTGSKETGPADAEPVTTD